ncbi:MAG: YopX family protein [Ignavibacteriaceae bacterium]
MTTKFRAWDKKEKRFIQHVHLNDDGSVSFLNSEALWQFDEDERLIIQFYIGLTSSNNEEWYVSDIGEFPNGDKFILKEEDWLEVFADWIGDPECEEQTKELYRIENAKKIGNYFENKNLLES